MRFRDLPVRIKLAFGFGSLALALVAVGGTGIMGTRHLVGDINYAYEQDLAALNLLLEADRDLQQMLVAERTLVFLDAAGPEFQEQLDTFAENAEQSATRWQKFKDLGLDGTSAPLAEAYEANRALWLETAARVHDLCRSADPDDRAEAFDLSMGLAAQQFETSRDQIDKLTEHLQNRAAADQAAAAATAATTQWTIQAVAAAALAIAAVLGFFIVRSVTGPLSLIVATFRKVAEGDLTQQVSYNAKDELGHFADDFNNLTRALRATMGDVYSAAGEVASAATQISASADELSSSAREQSASTERASGAVTEMQASVEDIAGQAADTAGVADTAGESASEGERVVAETVTAIRSIDDLMRSASTAINALGQRADTVGQVMDVIREIADQTNLLALNAAIEAARAGEHGRGFAVVADEVRKLAERTTTATEEVTESILAIQSDTRNAVDTMDRGVDAVADGVSRAETAGQALARINAAAAEVRTRIGSISASVQQQAAASGEIADTVSSINTLIQSGTAQTEQSAAAASQLSSRAEQLLNTVSRFKV
jgi:methyl-accepting chemotaxis protein